MNLEQEWRCYHFGNFYMSSIQQGIQAAHAQMELFNKYSPNLGNKNEINDTPEIDMLYTWSNYHKTMVCLNGGMNTDLQEIHMFLDTYENPYPWSAFRESEEALGGIITNVAIVLPERIYDTAAKIRSRKYYLNGTRVMTIPEQPMTEDGAMLTVHIEPGVYLELTKWEVDLINLLNSCGLAK